MTDILRDFSADELQPAETAGVPARGDLVSFGLEDGSATVVGRVAAVMENGSVKVRVDGIGAFLVPSGYSTVVWRAQ